MDTETELVSQPVVHGHPQNRLRLVRRFQVDNLVGKLLTYIDATYSNIEQRDAHKSIVKQTVYKWFGDCALDDWDEDELQEKISEVLLSRELVS